MSIKQQTPQIRFTGFSEDWIEKKLADVLKIKSGLSQKEIEVADGIYPILATGGEIGRTNTALYNKESVLIGRKGTIDKPYYMNTPFWTVDTLFYSELSEHVSGLFVFTLFQKIQWRKLDTSTGVPSLTSSTIHNIIANFPTKDEQAAIGNLFQNIDQTIALQRHKHEQTQTLKKSLLSKMFPQKGQKQPEIRLNGFSGDWVESELGEAVGVVMGQSPESKYYTNNPKDSILVQGNADLKNGRVVPRVWTVKGTKKASPNDIIMSVRAPVGDIGKTDFDVVIGRGVAAIKGNDFIYQMLMKMKIDDFWKKVSTGSTFESISSSDIKEALIMLPNSQQEQTAIGQFFKQFDDTLSLQAKQLKTLENLKQALLAKMFV